MNPGKQPHAVARGANLERTRAVAHFRLPIFDWGDLDLNPKSIQRYLKFSLEFGLQNWNKNASRKDAKAAKSGEIFLSLRSWRLGAINSLELVLFNISKVSIQNPKSY
jgi:hypothetical protein